MKQKTKALIASVAMATAMTVAPTAQATGIPVFDGANVAQAISQIMNQVQQIQQMKNQVKSLTGNSGLGVLLNDPTVSKALAKYTPKGVNLKDLADGNYDSTLQGIAKRIEAEMKANNKNQDPRVMVAQAQIMRMAQLEQSMNTLNSLAERSESIARQINMTTDASSKADLANTLQANSSQIQIAIAQTQLQMKQMELLEKQAQEALLKKRSENRHKF